MPPKKIIQTPYAASHAVGEEVEVALGGADAPGVIIDTKYDHQRDRWKYKVRLNHNGYENWYPEFHLTPKWEQSKLDFTKKQEPFRWKAGDRALLDFGDKKILVTLQAVGPHRPDQEARVNVISDDNEFWNVWESELSPVSDAKTAAKPTQRSKWKEGDTALLNMGARAIPVRIREIRYNLNKPTQEPRVHVYALDGTNSWAVWESDLRPMQMDLFANWLEKSRDMYRVDTQPVGHDRKKVEGPFPRTVPNTYLELPMEKPLSKKMAAGRCQMCGTPMSGTSCPRCKYTPTRKQFFGSKVVTAGDVIPFRQPSAPAPTPQPMQPDMPSEEGDVADALLYQFDMLKGELENLFSSAQSWAAESSDPQEVVRLKRMAAKLQQMLKIIAQ